MTDRPFSQWIPVASALSGVIVGFLLGFVRDWWEGRKQRRRLAVALSAEVRALLERYEQVFGAYIRELEEGKPLERLTGAFRQEFFVVFDRNTDKLGLFGSEDLKRIVRAYVVAKGHLETLNFAVALIHDAARGVNLAVGASDHALAVNRFKQIQVEATATLKMESEQVMSAAKEVLDILARYTGGE